MQAINVHVRHKGKSPRKKICQNFHFLDIFKQIYILSGTVVAKFITRNLS